VCLEEWCKISAAREILIRYGSVILFMSSVRFRLFSPNNNGYGSVIGYFLKFGSDRLCSINLG